MTHVGTGGAPNPSAAGAFNVDDVMLDIAYFYQHPTRGAGIELLWVKRPFVPLQGPSVMNRPNAYRYTGDMVYTPKQGTQVTGDLNGSAWVSADAEYREFLGQPNREQYYSVFPPANGMFQFMMEQNRDMQLSKFVLLLLPSRHAWVTRENNNAPYKVYPQTSNAFTILADVGVSQYQQGSVVNIVGLSEERPFNVKIAGVEHYSNGEFLNVLGYAIAHELFHLLCGPLDNMTPNTVFGLGPYLSTLTVPSNELLQINLKTKQGVTP